jgi:hypothetical protein
MRMAWSLAAANRNNCLKMQGKGWLDSPSNSSVLVFDSTKHGRMVIAISRVMPVGKQRRSRLNQLRKGMLNAMIPLR